MSGGQGHLTKEEKKEIARRRRLKYEIEAYIEMHLYERLGIGELAEKIVNEMEK